MKSQLSFDFVIVKICRTLYLVNLVPVENNDVCMINFIPDITGNKLKACLRMCVKKFYYKQRHQSLFKFSEQIVVIQSAAFIFLNKILLLYLFTVVESTLCLFVVLFIDFFKLELAESKLKRIRKSKMSMIYKK